MLKNLVVYSVSAIMAVSLAVPARAQVGLPTVGSPVNIDLSSYAGNGFAPVPPTGGLSSNDWAVDIESGSFDFGETGMSGEDPDYAAGLVTEGQLTDDGVRGVAALDTGSQRIFWLRPTGSVLSPGSFTLRLQNNTGSIMAGLDVSFDAYYFNHRERNTLISLSHSMDNETYTPVEEADVLTPAESDETPVLTLAGGTSPSRSVNIGGLNVTPGSLFYLRWTTADGGEGGGQRDEHGFGNISVTPLSGGNIAPQLSNPSVNVTRPTSSDDLVFTVDATDPDGTIAAVRLQTSADNVTFAPSPMSPAAGDSHTINLGSLSSGTPLYYYFEAEDNEGAVSQLPDSSGPAFLYVTDERPGPGQIVINEIQYTQAPPQPASTDWVELHNTGTTAADISFFTFIDNNPGNPVLTLPLGTVIAAGGFAVLVQGSEFNTYEPWADVPVVGSFDFGLSSGNDSVVISDDAGSEYARVDYTSADPWPSDDGGAAGRSIELVEPSLNPTVGGNWAFGPVDGTPGAANSTIITSSVRHWESMK